ncbi:hypothetical protein TSUD_17870 [Trifolium subterraneum]|uniref:Reverse transcriptase domain-containing protein n=1 Tax=Trifolium subterraneum TaxID=3900 RepID=A0A2Z6LZ06_TRISU|nr:hypothetical protein TSUD_17870 [Trifolium subterraneum]
MWLKEEDVGEVVEESWHGVGRSDITTRVFRCAQKVQEWGRRKRMRFKQEVAECSEEMERLRAYFDHLVKENMSNHEPILSLITPRVTQEDNERLLAPITKVEIHEAFLQMHPDKAPGPDGFNPVVHALKRKTKGARGDLALKIDISKAYDKVYWGFMRGMLERLGFAEKVDSMDDALSPGRGLRQGDPLSPYLFILVTEGLSTLIKHYVDCGDIHGVKICRGAPPMSHILFADDCFLFCRSNLDETRILMNILKTYEEASRQEINMSKSEVFFSRNISMAAQEDLSRIMGVKHVLGNGTYLGLPSMVGRSKKSNFVFVKYRIWKRINSWRGRALSKAGKEIMIKSVLQAIPSYIMSVYLIPETTIKEIGRMINSFWWGGGANNGGIKWLAWDRMTYPKEYGGLGFRDLHLFNMATVAKQGWNLITKPNTLVAKVYKARRYGTKINVMNEPWLKKEDELWMQLPQAQGMTNLYVNQLMLPNEKEWDSNKIHMLFPSYVAKSILVVPLFEDVEEDHLVWDDDMYGHYNVKSGYKLLLQPTVETAETQGEQGWKHCGKSIHHRKSNTYYGVFVKGVYQRDCGYRRGTFNAQQVVQYANKGMRMNGTSFMIVKIADAHGKELGWITYFPLVHNIHDRQGSTS